MESCVVTIHYLYIINKVRARIVFIVTEISAGRSGEATESDPFWGQKPAEPVDNPVEKIQKKIKF